MVHGSVYKKIKSNLISYSRSCMFEFQNNFEEFEAVNMFIK